MLTTRNGRPIEPRNINRAFDIRCARAGVRRITIHDTRRTCGSLLAALDVHPRVAMAILRHSRIALTMEIYTQVPDEASRPTESHFRAAQDRSSHSRRRTASGSVRHHALLQRGQLLALRGHRPRQGRVLCRQPRVLGL